jgi:SHS2 domain-containing protein
MLGNPNSLRAQVAREATLSQESLDLLLVRVLDEMIYFKDAEGLFLRARQVRVTRRNSHWQADLRFEGEPIDPERHQCNADIKAITLHRLSVTETKDGWQATVVVDV